jgi:hypothetical protein
VTTGYFTASQTTKILGNGMLSYKKLGDGEARLVNIDGYSRAGVGMELLCRGNYYTTYVVPYAGIDANITRKIKF